MDKGRTIRWREMMITGTNPGFVGHETYMYTIWHGCLLKKNNNYKYKIRCKVII